MNNRIIKLFESREMITTVKTEEVSQIELNKSVNVEGGLHFDNETKKLINNFLNFCVENLGLKTLPQINILSQKHQGMTYGVFDPNVDDIKVYAKDRGFADVLRTTAHELTHFWQKSENRIPSSLKGRDHKLEAEANTKAGDLVYMFGLKNPSIYELGFKSDVIEKPVD